MRWIVAQNKLGQRRRRYERKKDPATIRCSGPPRSDYVGSGVVLTPRARAALGESVSLRARRISTAGNAYRRRRRREGEREFRVRPQIKVGPFGRVGERVNKRPECLRPVCNRPGVSDTELNDHLRRFPLGGFGGPPRTPSVYTSIHTPRNPPMAMTPYCKKKPAAFLFSSSQSFHKKNIKIQIL